MNEHFFALKNKYNQERGEIDKKFEDMEMIKRSIEGDNEGFRKRIEILNEDYYALEDHFQILGDETNSKIQL